MYVSPVVSDRSSPYEGITKVVFFLVLTFPTQTNTPPPPDSTFQLHIYHFVFRSVTERKLKAAREEIETLRARLRDALKISEEQKQQFRVNVEELKSQLHDAISKRDSVLAQKYVFQGSKKQIICLSKTCKNCVGQPNSR